MKSRLFPGTGMFHQEGQVDARLAKLTVPAGQTALAKTEGPERGVS